MRNFVQALFGCSHKRTTFPITVMAKPHVCAPLTARRTYVVCLDCGQEFAYDWQQMKLVPSSVQNTPGTGPFIGVA